MDSNRRLFRSVDLTSILKPTLITSQLTNIVVSMDCGLNVPSRRDREPTWPVSGIAGSIVVAIGIADCWNAAAAAAIGILGCSVEAIWIAA